MLLPEEKVKEKVIEKERSLIEKIKETPEPFRIFSLKPSMIKSYITSDDNVDDLLEIQLVPFESLVQVPEYHSHFRNMHYHLRFYFPKTNGKDAKYKHLFIMFNGLAESTPAIYDDLGLEFAKHGIPSALFPLPNHFFR